MIEYDSMAAITARLVEFRDERSWGTHHSPHQLAMSVAIEAGELLECFQWEAEHNPDHRVSEEIADVLIYALNLAERLGIDPASAVWAKIASNAERYPVP